MTAAPIRIGRHTVGAGHPTFIIAEIGATHAGDVERAEAMIAAAAEAGAQAVKLQTVNPDYSYCEGTLSHEVFQELQLSFEGLLRLKKAAQDKGLILFTTPGDFPSLEQAEKLDLELMKVSSGLMTNKPLIEGVARLGKPMIISSGMAYLDEIARSVRFARDAGADQIAVLHCTSCYPCPDEIVNLRAIPSLQKALGTPVGFSDHTADALAGVAAVAVGAAIIEKHMALSHELAGPEKGTACDPAEFAQMVRDVRRTEKLLGDGVKAPAPQESEGRLLHRRSVISVRAIPKGTVLTKDDISIMRGRKEHIGASPELFDSFLGRRANRNIAKNEPIEIGKVED